MKANELRIGNWVFNGQNIQVTPKQIEWFNEGVYDLLPIELTEEWLLKFGFNVYGSYNFKGAILNSFSLEKQEDFDWEYDRCLKTIKYVHQLQNLYFALTGEELKLKDNE